MITKTEWIATDCCHHRTSDGEYEIDHSDETGLWESFNGDQLIGEHDSLSQAKDHCYRHMLHERYVVRGYK